MNTFSNININDLNYLLPENKIAKYPLDQRDLSKLLIYKDNNILEDVFRNISDYLPPDSLILFNDTKVINARLLFFKETGARIEIFCLEPVVPKTYMESLNSNERCSWKCLVGNSKKWKNGCLYKQIKVNDEIVTLKASQINDYDGSFQILFEWDNKNILFSEVLESGGYIPVPPYLNRDSEELDKTRYQTIYSRNDGSVAAPTAGLHFTDEVFDCLKRKNVIVDNITLHVGAGTFKPIKADKITLHEMHAESFRIKKNTIIKMKENAGNITAVGTTTVRTIESIYQIGLKIINENNTVANKFFVDQWEAYKNVDSNFSNAEVLDRIVNWMEKSGYDYLDCLTRIIILPGYEFKFTDRLITNFHQPKSTLLLLLAAFTGQAWKDIYKYALDNDFRFLSYGDSSLIFKNN